MNVYVMPVGDSLSVMRHWICVSLIPVIMVEFVMWWQTGSRSVSAFLLTPAYGTLYTAICHYIPLYMLYTAIYRYMPLYTALYAICHYIPLYMLFTAIYRYIQLYATIYAIYRYICYVLYIPLYTTIRLYTASCPLGHPWCAPWKVALGAVGWFLPTAGQSFSLELLFSIIIQMTKTSYHSQPIS